MPNPVQQAFIEWLVHEEEDRQAQYRAYRKYYDGEHGTQLSERQRQYLSIKTGEEFRSNYCLPPGQAVVTREGLTNIEDVRRGDVVLGHDGALHAVLATSAHPVHETIVHLRTFGSPDIAMTADHPVYATKRKTLIPICAKYADGKDTIRCFGMAPNKAYRQESVRREWVPAGELEPGDLVWAPVFDGDPRAKDAIPQPGAGLLRLLGWYLAEGSVSDNGRLAFSFHADETEYQAEVERLLRHEFGVERVARCVVSENSLQLVVYSDELCAWFANAGGRGAAHKRILPDLFNSGLPLTDLLCAAWAGDGTKTRGLKKQTDYTTVSPTLAVQMQNLLAREGIVSGLQRRAARIGHLESFGITVGGDAARQLAALLGDSVASVDWNKAPNGVILDGCVGHAVAYTRREYYEGLVYNFETADCASYVLPGQVAVHNCPIIVDALVERLQVTGFECEGQAEQLWEWWGKNRMDALQKIEHLAAARDGDAYLLVGWDSDKDQPTLSFEEALVDGEGVQIVYSDERNVPMLATKRWLMTTEGKIGKQRRMNVYYPDRIERYLSDDDGFEGGWQPYAEKGRPAVEKWVDGMGEPLGLPVIHFKNKDTGYNFGTSELRDVIPLQNALNKTIIDLMAAADTTAFRIFWMMGDDPSALKVAPGSWIYSTRPPTGDNGAQVGYFPGEDLSNLIKLIDAMAIEIARVTRTPVSYFQVSGQRPAEGTLKQEESGLVGKIKDRQVAFGNCWEDAMALARRLANTFGGARLDETQQISTVWADPETRNEKLLLDGLQVKAALGVPTEQLWREAGYDAEQIAEMQAQRATEERERATLGGELLRDFDRNVGGGARARARQEREPKEGPDEASNG